MPARGIDRGGEAVVGRAKNPAAVLRRAHADDLQVLLAGGAVAEVAVVREIDQQTRRPRRNGAPGQGTPIRSR